MTMEIMDERDKVNEKLRNGEDSKQINPSGIYAVLFQ
jgi:hypothetical protein